MGIVTCHVAQGLRRYQEDRHFRQQMRRGWALAVMDGHGGDDVSQFCREELENLTPFSVKLSEDARKRMRKVFSTLNSKTRHFLEGSTLSKAWILEDRNEVVVGILGDSPVIIMDEDGKVYVSPEHNVRSNPRELQAAMARGAIYRDGYIYDSRNGKRGLQLSRALGDANLDSILSREPDIYTVKRPRWVFVGSDGTIDPDHTGNKRHVEEIVSLCRRGATASDLIKRVVALGLQDNATAVVWHAKERPAERRKPGPKPKKRVLA